MEKKRIVLFLFLLFFLLLSATDAKANSITTKFKMEEEAVTLGKKFRVRLIIASQASFRKVEGYIRYDDTMLQYISSDDGISGGRGKLKISMDDLEEGQYVEEYVEDYGVEEEDIEEGMTEKSFEIVFKAIKNGKTGLSFVDGLKIYGEEGKEMSFSSNSLEIRIKNQREASGISSLSLLEIEEATLKPVFSKSIFQYEVQVEEEIEKLTIRALPTDENAKAIVVGNGNFKEGKNLIKVIVTAEGGNESSYEILVDRKKKEFSEEKNVKENREEKDHQREKSLEGGLEERKEGEFEENYEEISKKEEGIEKKKVDRKKVMFYGIMTAVAIVALIGLRLVWGKLKKLEEEK